ncbi:unnamed protein product, partial [Mesorhabditis spiculigera]
MTARALHYVFKIGDRQKSYDFFVKTLGMKILRHEEFQEGCAAECNGPYNGLWSKTMVGYGAESSHFVLELTYNYTIGGYKLGNDYESITISGGNIYDEITKKNVDKTVSGNLHLQDPDGHLFIIAPGDGRLDIQKVAVRVKDLENSLDYWNNHLKMPVVEQTENHATLAYEKDQAAWQLIKTGATIDRGSAYGRIAFAYPGKELKDLEKRIEGAGFKVLKPFVTLETPGKADVQVVILADPVDPGADAALQKAMAKDNSNDWFKDGGKKTA